MELENFIKTTLINIKDGVHFANETMMQRDKEDYRYFSLMSGESKEGGFIEFDIAVSTTQENNRSGGGGVKIYIAELGGKEENKNKNY